MKKSKLVDTFVSAIEDKNNYIAIYIQIKNSLDPEMILILKSNFKQKLKYYVDAYDDDLRLKTNNNIYIFNVEKINSFSELDQKKS